VEWGNSTLMREFPSKSLNRTFPEILFVDRWGPAGQAPVAISSHGMPAGHPGAGAGTMGAAAAAGGAGGGAVKSVTNSAGYTYLEVDQGGGKVVWVAAMQTAVKAGDKVQWQGGMTMTNFTARSLNRTFESIVFAQGVKVGK